MKWFVTLGLTTRLISRLGALFNALVEILLSHLMQMSQCRQQPINYLTLHCHCLSCKPTSSSMVQKGWLILLPIPKPFSAATKCAGRCQFRPEGYHVWTRFELSAAVRGCPAVLETPATPQLASMPPSSRASQHCSPNPP